MFKINFIFKTHLFLILAQFALCLSLFAEEKPEFKAQMGHSKSIKILVFSPDIKYALSASDDVTFRLWDITSSKEMRTFSGHSEEITSLSFSYDGKYVLSSCHQVKMLMK